MKKWNILLLSVLVFALMQNTGCKKNRKCAVKDVALEINKQNVAFDAKIKSKEPLVYLWNFGDGTESTTQTDTTSHIYKAIGTYQATLTTTFETCQDVFLFDVVITDIDKRQLAIDLYNSELLGSTVTDPGWTGSTATCDAGIVPQEVHDKVLQRVNYFRNAVGLGPVTLDPLLNAKCQEAALIMRANNSLNHNPPNTWLCWNTDGDEAAGMSNLSLGNHTTGAVYSQMRDAGSNNTAAGHRRWILYSKGKVFGHGSTSGSQALWVLGNSGNPMPADYPGFVSWPPADFVPAPLVFPRWSLSVPGGGFTGATVSMKTEGGANIPLTIISTQSGYGDNTIVWEPTGVVTNDPNDLTYTVTVANVMVNGAPEVFEYDVTIVQP